MKCVLPSKEITRERKHFSEICVLQTICVQQVKFVALTSYAGARLVTDTDYSNFSAHAHWALSVNYICTCKFQHAMLSAHVQCILSCIAQTKFKQAVTCPGVLHKGLEASVVCPPTCHILHEILCVLSAKYRHQNSSTFLLQTEPLV